MDPFVIVIVFVIIAGLINSVGRRGAQPGRRTRPPGNHPGIPGLEEIFREFSKSAPRPLRQPIPRSASKPTFEPTLSPLSQIQGETDLDKDLELAQSFGKEGEWGDEGRPDKLIPGAEPTLKTVAKSAEAAPLSTRQEDVLELSDKEIIQGVIWAEILARPRAQRRFRGPRGM